MLIQVSLGYGRFVEYFTFKFKFAEIIEENEELSKMQLHPSSAVRKKPIWKKKKKKFLKNCKPAVIEMLLPSLKFDLNI